MSGSVTDTMFVAGALAGATLLAEAGLIWLFFGVVYGAQGRGRVSDGRLAAGFAVLLGVIIVPPAAQMAWYTVPGQGPSVALAAARSENGRAAAVVPSSTFSLGDASAVRGKGLFEQQGCLACHRLQGKGGNLAPDLWGVANRREAEWIYRHFRDPQGISPGTLMPRFPLADEQFKDLTAYLLTLRENP